VSGSCPNISFQLDARAIDANAKTDYGKSACSDVVNGRNASVAAQPMSSGPMTALRIEVKGERKH